ncbi:Carnitine monooxygenase reductase subunit [Roseobacter fucihabitans]|uniref:Carnitine monooxygenase reductase subunit n=1 Tax=Roseobacter fucihabitans TaxID=1537242 RepID=A0ABZ2BPL3_9RHOB|nr:reductive dehalogenase [Roseobacter litoralis]MBC6965352.1 3-chloro-4-hydroxyphenylacetate reductive dehalogenase precursor [Roseobacter litoralis]MBC6965482.1 3-chloro-4-hydroxyphenylacetate reductive dehalogenase precursor [Roseobacter litoralis]
MTARLFSTRNRPFHLGPFPLERLARDQGDVDLSRVPEKPPLHWDHADTPRTLISAMGEYQAMLDAIRDGLINSEKSKCPDDLDERARHIKSFGYFQDAPMVGIGRFGADQLRATPIRNRAIDRLAEDLKTKQTKTLAAGIDTIMADLRDSMSAPPHTLEGHTHTVVFLYNYNRDPMPDEPGYGWMAGANPYRASLLAAETAIIIAGYLRVLGYDAKAHTASACEVDLNKLTVGAGLATLEEGRLVNPFVGDRFQVAAITTNFAMTPDAPLVPLCAQSNSVTRGWAWNLGMGSQKNALTLDPYATRNYAQGAYPFETLKRVEKPTTFIDEARVARVPKRTDMFARAQFGDMGKANQEATTGGYFAQKTPISHAIRRPSGAFLLLQQGPVAERVSDDALDAARNAEGIKAAAYFLGADAVGISRCPEWAWYSHDALGAPIVPTHQSAISMIIDQGFETTEGSSGDDWIAVTQSMRAYLRFSLLGGIIGKHIRNLGYEARVHTNLDGEVLQPPLLLLAGLGEVSRIGEVIVNPFLGPRLKSGCITTNMPLAHDKPIDFGMQAFCESCNKCARECPSGAITAGPKLMFNGYEIWKSDSQKCTTYRLTQMGGAMCGRCMKTCPWNVEGLQHEKPLRWIAMNVPAMAGVLAKADDLVGNGRINPQKRWWWDLKVNARGGFDPVEGPSNQRDLQTDLKLKYEDQTLAVYPANLAPPPWPFPFPMDREKGIEAYQALITAKEYQARLERGAPEGLAHVYLGGGDAPVTRVQVSKVTPLSERVVQYELTSVDGTPLPSWEAGAHIDIVVAPEFVRQYSLSGDPADRSCYKIAVLREDAGRGGSRLMHKIFSQGRRIFISNPINHFPLAQEAGKHFLMGGGIGITPMIAFAHQCHANGQDFELHYCAPNRADAAFASDLLAQPWADNVHLHISEEGTRAAFEDVLCGYEAGWHVYACGPDGFMAGVTQAAQTQGFPPEACHVEYFSVPELPEYENHAFKLKIARSGQEIVVPANKAASDVLIENGFNIDVKCSDGICGVCKCGLVSGEVEHRDFVLSQKQRQNTMILCQSRAAKAGEIIEIDL